LNTSAPEGYSIREPQTPSTLRDTSGIALNNLQKTITLQLKIPLFYYQANVGQR
jgi:hypothetical protein